MKTLFKYEFKRQKVFLLIMVFVAFLVFLLNLQNDSSLFSMYTFRAIAYVGVIGTIAVIGAIGIIRSLAEDMEDSSPLIGTIPLSGPRIMYVKLVTTVALIGLIMLVLAFFSMAADLVSALISGGLVNFQHVFINSVVKNLGPEILSGFKTLVVAAIYISIMYLGFVVVKTLTGRVSFFKVALVALVVALLITVVVSLVANNTHLGFSLDNMEFFPAYVFDYDRDISSNLNGYYEQFVTLYSDGFSNEIDDKYLAGNNINIIPTLVVLGFTALNTYIAGRLFDKKVTF